MTDTCLFCRIVRKEIPAKIVWEDARALAFRDIDPKAPTHVLVIPKQHLASLNEAPQPELLGHLLLAARQIAALEGIAESGYRVVLNSGPDAGQTVSHLHVHLLGGRRMTWPPG